MPSPEILDFESMLAPISEESPAGVPLRGGDSDARQAYQKVKDARDVCRNAERQMLNSWGSEDADQVEPADWSKVKSAAIEVLSNRSKDLWIAAWLLESLIREDGFAGLRDGFRFIREMVEKYFEYGIHPLPDKEFGETLGDTTAQLTGLFDGVLAAAIDTIPIALGDDRDLNGGDYKMSWELEKITDPAAKQNRIDSGTYSLAQFESFALNDTPADFLRNNYEDAQAAMEEFQQLCTVLDEKFGYEYSPPTSGMKESLEECLSRLKSISEHTRGDEEEAGGELEGASPDGALVPGGQGVAVPGGGGRVATRDDAFKALEQVAKFFEQTEPHSLIPFALKQVISWGKMSLPELLKELINDETVLNDLNKRTGVPRLPDPPEEY